MLYVLNNYLLLSEKKISQDLQTLLLITKHQLPKTRAIFKSFHPFRFKSMGLVRHHVSFHLEASLIDCQLIHKTTKGV